MEDRCVSSLLGIHQGWILTMLSSSQNFRSDLTEYYLWNHPNSIYTYPNYKTGNTKLKFPDNI